MVIVNKNVHLDCAVCYVELKTAFCCIFIVWSAMLLYTSSNLGILPLVSFLRQHRTINGSCLVATLVLGTTLVLGAASPDEKSDGAIARKAVRRSLRGVALKGRKRTSNNIIEFGKCITKNSCRK